MILSKDNSKIFYCMLVAYSFFAFLSPLSSIFFIFMCALMIVSPLVLDNNDSLCFLAYASCFMACFDIISRFLKMIDLTMAIWLVKKLINDIKYKNKKNIIFTASMAIFFVILFIYSIFITHFHIYKLWQTIGLLLVIVNFYLIGKVSTKKLTLILSIGLIISAIMSAISYFCGVLPSAPFILDSVCGFRFSAYFNYVNALALYCSLCQTCLLSLILSKRLDIKKWIWLPITITVVGLFTFSKSFILITILTYLITTILGFMHSDNKSKYTKLFIVGAIIIGVLILIFNDYIASIIKRFYADTAYGDALNIATTGRLGIWKSYFKHWSSSALYVLFGCGITANSVGEFTPHNLFISILYRFGIIGTSILIGFIVFIIKQIKTHKSIYYYLPLIAVLINACFEDITSSLFTCLPILIALCFIIKDNEI